MHYILHEVLVLHTFQVSGFRGIVQTSGFLVPGKTDGQLEVYNEETLEGPWNLASRDGTGWSYHTLLWHDMDNDGLLDVFTARFHVNLIGQTKSELVWMKNPGNLGHAGENWSDWEQFVLIENGPDVVISLHTFEYEGQKFSGLITGKILRVESNGRGSFLPRLILFVSSLYCNF